MSEQKVINREKRQIKRREKRKEDRTNGKKITTEVALMKREKNIPSLSVTQVQRARDDVDDQYHNGIVQILTHLDKYSTGSLRNAVAAKVLNSSAMSIYQANSYKDLDPKQKRTVLQMIIADDLGSIASSAVKVAGPALVSYLWGKLKETSLFSKVKPILRDYMGLDVNDDPNHGFTINSSIPKKLDWEMITGVGDLRYQYDAVSVQAICSLLCPELTSVRIPSDIAVKCGLLHRQQTFTVTTNAAGNAAAVILPQYFDRNNWYGVFNDASLNLTTGQQTPNASWTAGPLIGYASTVNSVRLTSFCASIQPIVSTLNNQGRCVSVMSDRYDSVSLNTLPYNLVTARDQQYTVYTNIPGLRGHRMVYDNSSVADESFTAFATVREQDAVEFMFEGCAPSTAVAQIVLTYTIEYTVLSNPLIDIQMPPCGPATMKAWDTALSLRPELRLLGDQESKQMYIKLINTPPSYKHVMATLLDFDFIHNHSEVIMRGSGGIADQNDSGGISGISGITQIGEY